MLIPFSTIFHKYNLKISGIIHVGAHYAEEHKDYLREGVSKVAYIEASKTSYFKLCRLNLPGDVVLHNVALADYEGSTEMYTETANQGQSSSLLKPGTHTAHYPTIEFNGRETVEVTTMDRLKLTGYNMLNLDVQGAELLVLKGAKETLEQIEYVYTEVNKEPVYENCALIDELDAFLDGFTRVETAWTGQGWGDAFYVRTGGRSIERVPAYLQPKMPFPYPPDNKIEFERWFYENVKPSEIKGRIYLPIFWTAFYVKNKYGKDKQSKSALQDFLNRLSSQKKYFTIVQYDDGILNNISGLDIKVFSMGGGRVDYPLPLICRPHPELAPVEKDILCSFVGLITHPIRQRIVEELSGKQGYYISTKPHNMAQFTSILNRSKFVLCPRGYGKTSFRIQEALQYGATPIYVSDEHVLPHDKDCCIRITESQIVGFNAEDIPFESGQAEKNKNLYAQYFTYEANKKIILENL